MRAIYILFILFIIILNGCATVEVAKEVTKATKSVKRSGVETSSIKFVSLLAAPEGIKNFKKAHGKLHLFTCSVDKRLNKNKFIVPGLGDAGDRYMGT